MESNYASPKLTDYMDTDSDLVELIPSDLWSLPYFSLPGILKAATRANPVRVGEVCMASANPQPPCLSAPAPTIAPPIRISAPQIHPYDGKSENLRPFCSQLVNEIQSNENQFPTEISKVRFAYRCLGPGALNKMRSSFRCLEDPSAPVEINNIEQFISALKQRCQDPSLCEKSSLAVEGLYQKNSSFHDFITLFEDHMADSTYATLDKSQWKVMLQRRLSTRLRSALVTAFNVPTDYHAFVAYLREKDAAFQEITASRRTIGPLDNPGPSRNFVPKPSIPINTHVYQPELTVSQGGSAMDLDSLSMQRGPDGRVTPEARNARRQLGRCFRCNKVGHLANNCLLQNHTVTSIDESVSVESESLKE